MVNILNSSPAKSWTISDGDHFEVVQDAAVFEELLKIVLDAEVRRMKQTEKSVEKRGAEKESLWEPVEVKRNVVETVLGGVVLLVAGLFLVFACSAAM